MILGWSLSRLFVAIANVIKWWSDSPGLLGKTLRSTTFIPLDLIPYLTSLINSSLTAGYVPSVLKRARVAPLLKKPTLNPSDVNNYRPVSPLSFLSKTPEHASLLFSGSSH